MKSSTFIKKSYILYIILFILIIIYILYSLFFNGNRTNKANEYDLKKDGVCILPKLLSEEKVKTIHNMCEKKEYKETKDFIVNDPNIINKLRSKILDNDNSYNFQDYIWIIEKSSVHTCHRDNNGDFFNQGQKHPSYTLLFYLENMDKCLGVIPTSHTSKSSYSINFNDSVINLLCEKGDAILFNANLIHVGSFNEKSDHLRIQMKLTHKEDIKTLKYYENYHKVLHQDNTLSPLFIKMQQNLSCAFPIISNWTQKENIASSRGSVNGANIGWGQQLFSYLFYGNSHFYDLPNAF